MHHREITGGKTVSRRALANEFLQGANATGTRASSTSSKQSSRVASHNPSRAASRAASGSEDSDDAGTSIASYEDDVSDAPEEGINWAQEFKDIVASILDRKRSSVQGREEAYAAYCRLSKFYYVHEELLGSVGELLDAFCRSIKGETSVRESTLALRAIELLALSARDNTIFENVEPVLSRTIRDSTPNLVKAAAIHTLGACAIFAGAGEGGLLDQMNFLLDIVASDGQSIDAHDDAHCVTAAIQEWGHMATYVVDLEAESEEAVQVFADQLDSNDAGVQIAAGENIALLYEKSYRAEFDWKNLAHDEDEGEEDKEQKEEVLISDYKRPYDTEVQYDGPALIQAYDAYHNTDELVAKLKSLATTATRRINKRDKKTLHTMFNSIVMSIEDARKGPLYSIGSRDGGGRHLGSRYTVKFGSYDMLIDKWWKWIRVHNMRRMLQSGFILHYHHRNPCILENLPSVQLGQRGLRKEERKPRVKTDKRKETRGFAIHDDH